MSLAHVTFFIFFFMILRPPISTLFPYTTLFRSLILSVMRINLSLTGIAGIILSIGMAVDANVVIFERIKEERSEEHTSDSSHVSISYAVFCLKKKIEKSIQLKHEQAADRHKVHV